MLKTNEFQHMNYTINKIVQINVSYSVGKKSAKNIELRSFTSSFTIQHPVSPVSIKN
jgi:hypothetical protein